jgi:hypothetical protein
MREPGVGRVLVASLHQAIADTLPTRFGFYETFLPADGLREGTIGLPALLAVLSFLRQEGEAYDRITALAGEYAAEWTIASMAPFERRLIGNLPAWLRARLVVRMANRLVRSTCEKSGATARFRAGAAHVNLRESVFCTVREPVAAPLCGFYAAAFGRLLALFDLPAGSGIESCRATGGSRSYCTLTLSLRRSPRSSEARETAA